MAVVIKKQLSGWLAPFLKKESAIKALQVLITDDKVTRGGMYCLELINQITQNGKQILERIPQEVFSGCPKGGRRNVEASALCRAGNGDLPTEPDAPAEDGLTRAQRIIGSWAERDGCWSDYTDTDQLNAGRLHDPNIDGSEARVYFDKGYVYKTIDFSHYPSMAAFLDRIAIHNTIFPETAMTVEGFGWRDDASDYKDYVVIIKQPYVAGTPPDTDELMEDVKRQINEKGFKELLGLFFVSESGNILLTDIHNRNCVLSKKGTALVFDCEAILNQSQELGGQYIIPTLQYDEEAVSDILKTIYHLLPTKMALTTLLDPKRGFFETEKKRQRAIEDLNTYGVLQRPLNVMAARHPELEYNYSIQLNPQNNEECLVMPVKNIAQMLENATSRLEDGTSLDEEAMRLIKAGQIVHRNGISYVFNLDKGRIDAIYTGRKLRLNIREEESTKNNKTNNPKI